MDGALVEGADRFENMVPISFERAAEIELSLNGVGLRVILQANGVDIRAMGPGPVY